jgi:hypothetical protein
MTLGEESDMDNVPLIEQDLFQDALVSDKPSSKWDFLVLTVPFFR